MVSRLQRSDFSRMWLIEFRAGPGNVPSYEGLWKAGAASWALGDVTNIYVPDSDQYGAFNVAGKIIGERGNPTLPVTARYLADIKSTLLRIARNGCDHDLQVHMGVCEDPQDFNFGWQKVLVLENARPTEWGATELGALDPGERAVVNEEVPFSGDEFYEIMRIVFAEKAANQVVQEVIDILVCDSVTCGACGLPSNGCDKVFALTLSAGGSPGLAAEIIFSADGGESWGDTNVVTLDAAEDPNAFACVGINLVVISEDSESLHYAPIADILAGTETWTEVTTGFSGGNGPLAIFSASPHHTWIVGENGYVYFAEDPTSLVTVQDAGSATSENLVAVNGIDIYTVVAVGANNAVLSTQNGGDTWSLITGPAAGVNLTAVWVHGKEEWFVGTADGRLYYTRDAGVNWTLKGFPGSGSGNVEDIQFSSQSVGWMAHTTAAGAGRILRTIDGGYSWYVAPEGNTVIPTNDSINALAPCESDVNIIFGGGLGSNAIDGIIIKGS